MAYELNYSRLDQMLHRAAFAGPYVQLTAADIERAVCGGSYVNTRASRPIFVTSLPRAGTTLMLEALALFPSLASHVYRDMPFVMAPVLWERLSGRFRQPQQLKERAHGDGMDVGFDSPEAFDEVFWRTFWPEKYTATGIDLWSVRDHKPDAHAFFAEHMKKIVKLRRPDREGDGRYVSKNNGNIARLDLLARMFPDARIVLMVREPFDHARSLLRQHENFLAMHRDTPFVRRYMDDIGHYEFGDLRRPIQFHGLDGQIAGRDPRTLDYWVGYWIAAFEHVVQRAENLIVTPYEACCADPVRAVTELCERLEIDDEGMLSTVAARFKPLEPRHADTTGVDPALATRARRLHESLVARRT